MGTLSLGDRCGGSAGAVLLSGEAVDFVQRKTAGVDVARARTSLATNQISLNRARVSRCWGGDAADE